MRVLVSGDRYYKDDALVWAVLTGLREEFGDPNITVIEGVCPKGGADKFAGEWAEANCPEDHIPVPAQWDIYGKSAGPIRNRQMLDMEPDMVIGFHDNIQDSKGTKDCLNEAKKRKILTYLVSRW